MTDTDGFAKAMMSPMMEQGQERKKKKVEENKLGGEQSTKNEAGAGMPGGNQSTDQSTGYQSEENQPGKDTNEQNGQTTAKVDSVPQDDKGANEQNGQITPKEDSTPQIDDDDNDMSLVNEVMENGIRVNTGGSDKEKETEYTKERRAHSGEISRLENEYRARVNGDETADMERVGVKEVLEVPNYREHVTDDQMQGWGRALASFGSVGLKEGGNAIDAATKTLGEFRKLTRAYLSPNPMSPISQAVASTMVGFNTMYDAIDRAGQIAGIKQGADKSIVMETARGAQYYKDKDNATRVANYIMQTFNDQIRDTLGPGGDVTQLNPAQFTRIYGKMKDGFFDSEIERIKHKYSTGQPLSLEDKAIVNGWDNLNKNYHKVLKDKEKTAREYAKEIGGHERAINALDRQYGKKIKAADDWKVGFDNAVRNKDQVGALIRMTLGPEANRRLRNGNVLLETLKGAQDQANSNATNPNFTPEQQAKWLKIASVFGKRVQTVRNMSVEQRKQYALRLSGAPKTEKKGSKGRSSGGKALTYTPLMSKNDMQAALNKTPTKYVADKLSDWMDDHRYSVYWGGSKAKENLYNAAKDMLRDLYGREYEAYRELGTDKLSGEDLKTRRAELKELYNKIIDTEDRLRQPATGYLTPHAFGDKLRKLDTQKERDEFIGNALEEAGVWVINPKSKKGYRADMDKLKDFLELETENMARDPEAFDALFTTLSRYQWGPTGRKILNGYRDKVTGMLQSMWNFEGTENPAPEGKEVGAGDGPGNKDRKEDRGGPGDGDGPGGQGDVQEEKEQEGYQAEDTGGTPVEENAGEEAPVEKETPVEGEGTEEEEIPEEDGRAMALERLEERRKEEEPAEEAVTEDPAEEGYTDSDERLDAEQSENGDESAENGGESAGSVETAREPSVSTNMEYKSKFTKKYNGMFEDVVNNDKSREAKIEGIDKILEIVNRRLDMRSISPATKDELRHLRDRLNKQRDTYLKEDSSGFERYKQNKGAENLKAANEEGPNPEHGETFNPVTSNDGSEFKNPPEDLRQMDSQKLSKELPDELSNEEVLLKAGEQIPSLFTGLINGLESMGNGVYTSRYKGANIKDRLDDARKSIDSAVEKIDNYKRAPSEETIKKLKGDVKELEEAWNWVDKHINNAKKETSPFHSLRRLTFLTAGNTITSAKNLIEKYGGKEEDTKTTDPSNPANSGNGVIEGQPKNTERRKRTGETKVGTGKSKQGQEEKQKEKEEKQKGYEDGLRKHYRTLDALKENKEKMSQEELGKYLGNIRTELFKVLKEMRRQKVGLSDDFKKEFEEKFKEASPPGHTIEFNWDAKDVSDLIKLTKTPVKRISFDDKMKDPNWNPTEDDKQYIQNHKTQIISTYFDGDEKKAKERFPFLKSAIPSFEELLRAKLNERYGPFIG